MEHEGIALMKRWFQEVWNEGRREGIDEMLGHHCIIHDGAVDCVGPAGFHEFYDRIRTAFSDVRVIVHEGCASGDLACVRWTSTLVHTGEFAGFPPTGKQLTITGISMARTHKGQLTEAWQNWDMLALIEQIRNAEAPAPTYMASAKA